MNARLVRFSGPHRLFFPSFAFSEGPERSRGMAGEGRVRAARAGILVAALILFAALGCSSGEKAPQTDMAPTAGALVIAYRPDSADTFTASRTDSVLALDWLREVTRTHDIRFEAETYPYGTLVQGIGPRQNGEGGYWLYKVNGQMVPKSADAHRVAWSDTLTFFFDER